MEVHQMSPQTWSLDELQQDLVRFEDELRAAGLRESSIRTYVDRSRTFVAWLAGNYVPRGPIS
jgi:hypothetical protein